MLTEFPTCICWIASLYSSYSQPLCKINKLRVLETKFMIQFSAYYFMKIQFNVPHLFVFFVKLLTQNHWIANCSPKRLLFFRRYLVSVPSLFATALLFDHFIAQLYETCKWSKLFIRHFTGDSVNNVVRWKLPPLNISPVCKIGCILGKECYSPHFPVFQLYNAKILWSV